MNKENTKVMSKEVAEMFEDKCCDVVISNDIVEDLTLPLTWVCYDEENEILSISASGVQFDLNAFEIDSIKPGVTKDDCDYIEIVFIDGTTLVITVLKRRETRRRIKDELLDLEFLKDSYKEEYQKTFD